MTKTFSSCDFSFWFLSLHTTNLIYFHCLLGYQQQQDTWCENFAQSEWTIFAHACSDFYLLWPFSSEYWAHENAWKIYFVWKKKCNEPSSLNLSRRQQQLRGITDRIIPVPVLRMKELPSEITLNFASNLNLTCESITFTDTFESANRGGFFLLFKQQLRCIKTKWF